MTYRSPFRDVADAFSGVAPNVAQGVANQAERKQREDAWARAAAQQQTRDLEARLTELTSTVPSEANKGQTDQQIMMVKRAMDMYRNVATAQPGKAYDAWMSVSSGALSVPVVGPQAAASPRERAAGRPTYTGETMSVPELMGRSGGTVARNLQTTEERRTVQASNSELVRNAFQFLMSPNAIDFTNPLAEEQAAMVLSSVNALMGMDVLPGMEDMQRRLPELARGLRSAIMQSGTRSERLRNLAMQSAENEIELQDLNVQQTRVNLETSRIEQSFLTDIRQGQLDLNRATLAEANERLSGIQFANAQEQYQAFVTTGLTGSPQQEAALMARLGIDVNDPAAVAAFQRTKQDNYNRFTSTLQRQSQRLDLELETLRSALNLDELTGMQMRSSMSMDSLKAEQMRAALERGDFEMERERWTFNRDRQLAEVKDTTDALAYVMQATLQGDAGALSFILREMQTDGSAVGQMFGQVFTPDIIRERYEYALRNEDLRSIDQERRAQLTAVQFENAMRRTNNDLLLAGVEVGAWASQSMTKGELAAWHADQVRRGYQVPSLANLEMQRAVHAMTLQSPIKQEVWAEIDRLATMPANEETISVAFTAIGDLLSRPELGLEPEVVETFLNGFVEAQSRNFVGYNLEVTSAQLRNELLRAQIDQSRAAAQAAMNAALGSLDPNAQVTAAFDTLVSDTETAWDAAKAFHSSVLDQVRFTQNALNESGCIAGTTTVQGGAFLQDQTTSTTPGDIVRCETLMNDMTALQFQLGNANSRLDSLTFDLDTYRALRAQSGGLPIPVPERPSPFGSSSAVPQAGPAAQAGAVPQTVPMVPTVPAAAPEAAPAAAPAAPVAPAVAPAAAPGATPAAPAAAPASAPAAAPRQQGPIRNPNPSNVPAPTLSPEQNLTPSNLPIQNRLNQESSRLAESLSGSGQGEDFDATRGTLTAFVYNGWHPSYRNANATQYPSPVLMAQAVSAMPAGPQRDRAVNDLRSYLRQYVQVGVRTPYRESPGGDRVVNQILAGLGIRQ
jgi:hypothetical protein